MPREAYGDKATYETSELSVKKLRTKKKYVCRNQKKKLIIFYDSNGIIHKKFVPQDKIINGDIAWAWWSVCWQELIGFLNTECKTTDRLTILFTGASPFFVSKSVPSL